jgi:regulator of sigma E protease
MVYLVAALILLGILIIVHEFGHFSVARLCGVGVEKFSVGFGKTVYSKTVGETEYILAAVPLGGYVKLVGEDPDEESPGAKDPAKSFNLKPVSSRMAIVAAGAGFNILLAVVIFFGIYLTGVPMVLDEPRVGGLVPEKPAERAGLLPGDTVLSIDGVPVSTWDDMAEIIQGSAGKELELHIQRGGTTFTVPVTPEKDELTTLDGQKVEVGLIGIQPPEEIRSFGWFESAYKSVERTVTVGYITYWGIYKMIVGDISPKNIGGPLFIGQLAGQQIQKGIVPYATLCAIISINLGIINLLPIPVLDGGHMIFLCFESIFRRPVKVKHREVAQQVGLFLLISLMVFAFYNDIMRFITS